MKPAIIASGPGVFSIQYVVAIGEAAPVLCECRVDANGEKPTRMYLVNNEEVVSCYQKENDPEAAGDKKSFHDFEPPITAALHSLSSARHVFQRAFWVQNPAQPVAALQIGAPTNIPVSTEDDTEGEPFQDE
jgi:hypothetical protein